MARLIPLADRFWSKVNKSGPIPEHRPDLGPCWLWTAGLNNYGYGSFGTVGRKVRGAHRVAYELLIDLVPSGYQLDHLCRVRRCVNPSHLEPVTGRVNLIRGNGWSGLNSRKTHCPQGHELAGDNIYERPLTALLPNPTRECLTCRRSRGRAALVG